MSRTLLAIFSAVVLLPMATPAPRAQAQTVDEVIAKNVQAHGGMDKLKSVNTVRMSGKINFGSFEARIVNQVKRPNKVREEFIVQGFAQVRAYDGKTGWQVNPFQGRKDAELLSQDDMKDLQVDADIDGPLVDYRAKGHHAELMGHDSVEGTDCYKIKLTLKNGDVRYYYLDADSFLEIKLETQTSIRGAIQESETYYGDYEQVQGIYYPLAIESGQKGDSNRANVTIEKVELNVPLDDSLFAVPPAPPAAKASNSGA
ncbi:MAG TPA: outer membrane lipoprotein-sorting protein [Terriglobia bacterium]|nr:outer membrane lipoprotein-sorting protein [Terriglobia bacterium]